MTGGPALGDCSPTRPALLYRACRNDTRRAAAARGYAHFRILRGAARPLLRFRRMHEPTLRERRAALLESPPRMLAITMACTTIAIVATGLIALFTLSAPGGRGDHRAETTNATGARGTDGVPIDREARPDRR